MKTKNTGTKCTTKTKCNKKSFLLSGGKKKKVEISFEGGDISNNGGAVLLAQADKKLGLLERFSGKFPDKRDPNRTDHSLLSMLRQRIFAIALGCEDLNDHIELRKDRVIQYTIGEDKTLASTSTLWRLEQNATREIIVEGHKLLFEIFISSHKIPPKEIILDFDATDDTTHGNQENSYYNGYYGSTCFLPLYVFCGSFLLVAYLRPSNEDGAKHSLAILSLLVKNIKKVWPNTNIIFRADSGFCRPSILRWCEKNDVNYIIGIPRNKVLERLIEPFTSKAKEYFEHTQEKQRIFGEILYSAETWDRERRIIIKAEHLEKGPNPRLLVTNINNKDPQELYDELYCLRGDMENRIKEQQLDLFSDRTRCNKWWPNQLRVLFSAFAYVLIDHIRQFCLRGSKLAKIQIGTIRLKLLKIGAIVLKNTIKIKILLSSNYRYKNSFLNALSILTSG